MFTCLCIYTVIIGHSYLIIMTFLFVSDNFIRKYSLSAPACASKAPADNRGYPCRRNSTS